MTTTLTRWRHATRRAFWQWITLWLLVGAVLGILAWLR